MRMILVALMLALAGSAQAQVTRCGDEFGKWVCRTEQPQQQSDIFEAGQRAYQQSSEMMDRAARARRDALAARAEQDAQRQASVAADHAQSVRKVIGSAIAHGECDYAKSLALKEGDLDLADQTARLCQAR